VLYQSCRHASQVAGTSASDIKLLSPSTLQPFADEDITLEDAGMNILQKYLIYVYYISLIGLTPRGLIIVQLVCQGDEDPR